MKRYVKADEDLASYAFSAEAHTRENLARRTTSAELMDIYLHDPSVDVRSALVLNPSVPFDVMSQLADDPDRAVRMFVASNVNTPVSILQRLAQDSDDSVRHYVAMNPSTPAELLDFLVNDACPLVSMAAKRNHNYGEYA